MKGKRVLLVFEYASLADSIVRGTTIIYLKMVALLKDAGAKEVHIRMAIPTLSLSHASSFSNAVCRLCNCIESDSVAIMPLIEQDDGIAAG